VSNPSKYRGVPASFLCLLRRLQRLLAAGSTLLIFAGLMQCSLVAQDGFAFAAQDTTLPDAPQPAQANRESATDHSQQVGAGTITGTVLDRNRNVLQGARITLENPSGSAVRTLQSGGNGQFSFTGLVPDAYKLTVSAPGMSTYSSPQIALRGGEFHILQPIILSVPNVATSVTVTDNDEELAEEQVHIAVQQRIGGVIPNFYSSYDWNAPPMEVKQKFQLGIRSIIDPVRS
jgi:hypothetical protein